MSSDALKKELKDLLKTPENRYCADCPIKGPTWASVNIGVFVCMPCSGIHRSLGTHITQVRSVDLDKWKPEWVEVMKTWGNAKANAVWEAKMPKGYDGKPNENEAQELTPKLQKFIRDKYERKKWYSESGAKKKKQESSSEEESEEEEEEVRPKKSTTTSKAAPAAAVSTAKKPVVVIKSATSSSTAAKPKPVAAAVATPVVDNLLDDFDPFGDSSFTPSFPSAAAAPAQTQGIPGFTSAPQQQQAMSFPTTSAPAAPATAPAPSKPAIDLTSLYGMSSQPPAMSPMPMTSSWNTNPTGGFPQQQAMPASSGFPNMGTTSMPQYFGGQGFPTQPSMSQQSMMNGIPMFPSSQPQPQPQQMPSFGGMSQPQPQQQFGMFTQAPTTNSNNPFGAPAPVSTNGAGMWGSMQQSTVSAAPVAGRPAAGSDPFSGLF